MPLDSSFSSSAASRLAVPSETVPQPLMRPMTAGAGPLEVIGSMATVVWSRIAGRSCRARCCLEPLRVPACDGAGQHPGGGQPVDGVHTDVDVTSAGNSGPEPLPSDTAGTLPGQVAACAVELGPPAGVPECRLSWTAVTTPATASTAAAAPVIAAALRRRLLRTARARATTASTSSRQLRAVGLDEVTERDGAHHH